MIDKQIPLSETKEALIEVTREYGPVIVDSRNIEEQSKIDILIHALPAGSSISESFIVVNINSTIYVSISAKLDGRLKAYVIGFSNIHDIINPFRLYEYVKEKLFRFELGDGLLLKSTPVSKVPVQNLVYPIGSMLLQQKVVLVGTLKESIEFLTAFFDVFDYRYFGWLKCELPSSSLLNDAHVVQIQKLSSYIEELREILFQSSIIVFSESKCYGFYSSSFTKRLEWLFNIHDKTSISMELDKFSKLINLERIENPNEFANRFSIEKKDAKFFQLVQQSVKNNNVESPLL